MSKSSDIKALAMWLSFWIEPYGGKLPDNGSENSMPLWVAILLLALYAVLLVLLLLGGYAWLSHIL